MKLDLRSFEGVAFDFDCTLAASLEAHQEAREYAFQLHGVEGITDDQKEIGHRHGNNPTTIIGGILKAAELILPDADPYTDPLVQRITKTKSERYTETTQHGLDPEPGALELFHAALEQYGSSKLAIVTTAPLHDVTPYLRRHEIAEHFTPERIITRDTAELLGMELKPAPDQYRYAARVLGVCPAKMLVVEDTTGGIQSAHSAGSRVLVVGSSSSRELFEALPKADQPDYFVDTFLDLELFL